MISHTIIVVSKEPENNNESLLLNLMTVIPALCPFNVDLTSFSFRFHNTISPSEYLYYTIFLKFIF